MMCQSIGCARERVNLGRFCKVCEAMILDRHPTGPVTTRSDPRWPDGQFVADERTE